MKRCDKPSLRMLVGLLAAGVMSCATAAEFRDAVDPAAPVPTRLAADTSKRMLAPRVMTAPKSPAAKRVPTVTLKRGQKQLFVPPGAVRTVDAAGNALIKLPDGRRIRILKGGRVEILGADGKVIERGRFVGWQDSAGIRAGERMGIRAGKQKGIRAGRRAGARASRRMSGRYMPAAGGQHLIFR